VYPLTIIELLRGTADGGKWLATGSADGIVKVWDLRRGRRLAGSCIMHMNVYPIVS
jgi:WD40 repeat protein